MCLRQDPAAEEKRRRGGGRAVEAKAMGRKGKRWENVIKVKIEEGYISADESPIKTIDLLQLHVFVKLM